MPLMIEQDKRTIDIKLKEGFSDNDLKKFIRESIQFKQIKSPKNKTATTSIKLVTVNFNDTDYLNPDDIIKNCLMRVFRKIKDVSSEKGYNRNFPLTQTFLDKNNINLGDNCETLDKWEEVKIKNFIFYYHVEPVMKEVYEYEFNEDEIDLEKDVTPEVIEAVHNRGKVSMEKTSMYNIKVIIPLKKLEEVKPKKTRIGA